MGIPPDEKPVRYSHYATNTGGRYREIPGDLCSTEAHPEGIHPQNGMGIPRYHSKAMSFIKQ